MHCRWMNLHLREVIYTSRDGDSFHRMAEVYVRGNTVKYLRVPEAAMAKVSEEDMKNGDQTSRPLDLFARCILSTVDKPINDV